LEFIIQVLFIYEDFDNGSNLKDKLLNTNYERTEYKLRDGISNSGESIARHPFFESHKGGLLGSDGKKVYFLGVIDIFTQYG
jgi:hypothetical protein